MDSLSQKVSDLICDRLSIDRIEKEEDWKEQFKEMDSLDVVDAMFVIEDKLKVKFPYEIKFTSFQQIIEFLKKERLTVGQ